MISCNAGPNRRSPLALLAGIWLAVSVIGPLVPWSYEVILLVAFTLRSYWAAVALWAALPAAAIPIAVRRLIQGRYGAALLWSMLPIAAILLWVFGGAFESLVRFHLNKPTYDAIVTDAEAGRCTALDRRSWHAEVDVAHCGAPIVLVFLWGGFLSGWHGVVYDTTDQIILAPRERNAAWQGSDFGGILGCSKAYRTLGGHYYLARGDYVQSGSPPCE